MRTCDLFDKYRDGELDAVELDEFQSHLTVCGDCRMKTSLLNNLVQVLKQEEIRTPDMAELIARRAFQKDKTWDSLVASWLRPGPALAALSLMLVLFSFLWLLPGKNQVSAYSEYETLMDEADSIKLTSGQLQTGNESAYILWLQQEGNSQ